jgi:predicted acetyltransferase
MKLRKAKYSDKKEFRILWDMCFKDSLEFRDWFFENRFIPSYSVCMEEDDKIVSEAQSIPYNVKIRDSVLYGTMMVGACTHPEYTRRGYMKEIYKYYMNLMYKEGVAICVHTPAVLRTYFYVGHYPVSDTCFIETEKSQGCKCVEHCDINMKEYESAILDCYMKAAEKYSGIIYRSLADMRLKCADYMADGGKCIGIFENDSLIAYAIYYETEEMIYAEEVMAVNEKSWQDISDVLINKGKGKKVTIKLPPDSKVECDNTIKTVVPRNVCGIANVSKVLKAVGKGLKNTILVTDEVIEENNGVFDLCGNKSNEKPQIEMPVYRLCQWIYGYRSLEEMAKDGEIKVNDTMAMNLLDEKLPKVPCHIIDEY